MSAEPTLPLQTHPTAAHSGGSSAKIVLVRHGETAWSASGRHTGLTDIPLTANGEVMARRVGTLLQAMSFELVLVSPLRRAQQTCALAGFAAAGRVCDDLTEWHYGEYEGLTTPEIWRARPSWSLWRDGCPGGESADQVAERVDRVLAEVQGVAGNSLLFAHGHVLRVLTARRLSLRGSEGRLFALATGTVSVLGFERDQAVIQVWNSSSPIEP